MKSVHAKRAKLPDLLGLGKQPATTINKPRQANGDYSRRPPSPASMESPLVPGEYSASCSPFIHGKQSCMVLQSGKNFEVIRVTPLVAK